MNANWLDRAIFWASPKRGARRILARQAIQSLGYEGARGGRRTEGWVATGASADAESQAVITTLRNRARSLVRDNAYAARAVDVKASNTVGTGITAEVDSKPLDKAWNAFVDGCDADGHCDLYGLQNVIERCRMESGEALIQFVPSRRITGSIATKLRVLEPDFLDSSRDGKAPDSENQIRHGIEYDAGGGMVVAYWLYPEHPGESWTSSTRIMAGGLQSVRVPAADVIHVFRKLRAGQTRGVTDFAPVVIPMRDSDDYDIAEVVRKRTEACLALIITTSFDIGDASMGQLSQDAKGLLESLSPGLVHYARQGESVTAIEPKAAGGYADFQRFTLRKIASGVGIPYELMTGDLSQVNYSSYRAGLVDFRRRLEQDQWLIYVHGVCQRIWDRFRAESLAMGLGGGRAEIEWTPPRFELIDPLKETQAELEACLAGFDTWDQIVRRRGWTASEQLEAIAAWQKRLDTLGVVLKSDHRTAIAAKAGAVEPTHDDESEEEAA